MLPLLALPLGALALVALYHTRRAMVALAMFLIGNPVLSWFAGYSIEVALYALIVPIMVGLSHVYSKKVLPRLQKAP